MNLEPNSDKYIYILSIDIGIINLAFILLEVNKDYSLNDIIWFDLMNITEFCHLDEESRSKCNISHTKTFADWMSHVFYLHGELFELCTHIVIERQPPSGHVAVEQLIFYTFRDKAVLIHPRSVHKFMNWSNEIDYQCRKQKSEQTLLYRLERCNRKYLLEQYLSYERKHDISDAYIQALFFLKEKMVELPAIRNLGTIQNYVYVKNTDYIS